LSDCKPDIAGGFGKQKPSPAIQGSGGGGEGDLKGPLFEKKHFEVGEKA